MDFLHRLQHIESKRIAVGLEKRVGAARQPINHLRAPHLLRASPGIEVTVALKREAMLLDSHVAHLHSRNELIDRQATGSFESVENFQALGAANFGK
jgi:hypothetical protein